MTAGPDVTKLPDHVAETVDAIARLKAQNEVRAGQRALRHAVEIVTQPRAMILLLAIVLAWVLLNGIGHVLGYRVPDSLPFFWMATLLALSSLCVTPGGRGTDWYPSITY